MKKKDTKEKNGKKINKYREITIAFLETINEIGKNFIKSFFYKQEFARRFKYYKINQSRFKDYFGGLRKRGYIEIDTKKSPQGKLIRVKLTQKGRLKLLEESKEEKIDGQWRMLSFDIPERMRQKRNLFRATIKRIGFRQVQQSLWACPFTKADQVELAIKECGVQDYVAYLIILKTDIESYLKKLFSDVIKIQKQ